MKKSFFIMAITMATVMMASVAVAETVDIGLGRMDQAEFDTLRQMVNGEFQPSGQSSVEKIRPTRIAEFDQSVVDEIQQAMLNTSDQRPETAFASQDRMVEIGTGSMATSEFCDLNKLVASNNTERTKRFHVYLSVISDRLKWRSPVILNTPEKTCWHANHVLQVFFGFYLDGECLGSLPRSSPIPSHT
jgi:hypothetical protein